MAGCIFCKIAAKEIQSRIIYEDDNVVAFEDINPQAPTHTLLIPRKHIETLNDIGEGDRELIGHLILKASEIAALKGLNRSGYRIVMNCLESAGQSVFHVHLHLLGGRNFGWPPG
ncbi:MAG: histidine triad nucleotide-binding protein [Acidobacteriota bacterium]